MLVLQVFFECFFICLVICLFFFVYCFFSHIVLNNFVVLVLVLCFLLCRKCPTAFLVLLLVFLFLLLLVLLFVLRLVLLLVLLFVLLLVLLFELLLVCCCGVVSTINEVKLRSWSEAFGTP